MGILNVTPDSFSDGGKWTDVDAAITRGYRLIKDGADIIDIGGESTRPGALPLSADQEWDRIGAVVTPEETGKTITQHNLETQAIPPRYRPVWLGLDYSDRAVLYRRIDLRVDKMLEDGLLDEIRALLALGVSPKVTAMQAIGYKEFFGYLNGACTLDEAAALCKQRSRNYAKRQLTWFRRNPDIHWLRLTGTEDFSEVLSAARQNIPFSAF